MLPLTFFKRKTLSAVFLCVCLVLFSNDFLAFGFALINELPHLVLDIHLGDDEFDHQYQTAAISPQDNALWVAVRFHKVGDEQSWNYSLWKFNQKGEKIHEIPIDNLKDRPLGISSFMILGNGDMLFIADPIYSPSMIRMNKDGKILFVRQLIRLGAQASISKVVRTSDNNFLLLGSRSGDALAINVDGMGEIIWEKTFDNGRQEFLVDGVSVQDGGVIAIGSSTIYQGKSFGASEILLLKLDKKGAIRVVNSFPGRLGPLPPGHTGCLMQDKNGKYIIVYDKGTSSMNRDIWIKALNVDFNYLWEKAFLKLEHDAGMFKLVPVSTGGFIAVGSKNFFLSVSKFDIDGKIIWDYLSDKTTKRRLAIFDLISNNGKVFILRSVHSSNLQKQRNDKIGALSFLPNGLLK